MLRRFKDFIDEINQDNSRNYKIQVLEKYRDNDDVKYFLNYVFNPYITTGLSTKKLNKEVKMPFIGEFDNVTELLEYLKTHNTGTDAIIGQVHKFVSDNLRKEPDLVELLYNIINKNLVLGVEVLSINKVMDNLIPTFDVMLANKYFDKPELVDGKEFTLTTKIDGGRIIAVKKNGVVKLYTRAGQEYKGLVDIEKELQSIPYDNFVVDGEITIENGQGLSSKDKYKQTMMITRKDGEKHGVKILAFDIMNVDEFEHQKQTAPYIERRALLNDRLNNLKYISILPALYSGNDVSKIMELLNKEIAAGEEGIMINLNDAPYAFKRTNDLLKVKKMHDVDLTVIGFEEGTNQNTGKLGAFIVDYKGNNLKVGSGMTKELREEVWRHKEDYLGLTISVQYFEETKNQQGGISLRFPVFLDFRYDK